MKVTKTLQRSNDLYIQFTEEELDYLNVKPGDKFSCKCNGDGSVALEKYVSVEIDVSDFSREVLELIVSLSIEKDITANEVIEELLTDAVRELQDE
jgi:uncharacterized protein (DUF2237 family)